jgi:cytochrome c peroxidase
VPVATALGSANTRLRRHAPTIVNAAWLEHFFWDGRAESLEEQARGPIEAPDEMNSSLPQIVQRLSHVREYDFWFTRLFPDRGVTPETILIALATYQRTIVAGWSPFDRWIEGDADAISTQAKRGFVLFNGKANCSMCHSKWNFTDGEFHDIGIASNDPGRAGVTGDRESDGFRFKTQSLRNIALRGPYMHNGQFNTLEDVVHHYARGGIHRFGEGNDLAPFEVSEDEVAALVAFLETLTEDGAEVPNPILPAN